jgi:hypothetical protein
MNRIVVALGMALLLGICGSGGATASDVSGKNRLKTLMTEKFNEDRAGLFKKEDGISVADQPRAFSCMMDAMMADMSDAEATRIVDMLEGKAPLDEAFVLYWIGPRDFGGDTERATQAEGRIHEICPDLAERIL